MAAKKAPSTSRSDVAKAAMAQQRREEIRSRALIWGGVIIAVAVIAGLVIMVLLNEAENQRALEAEAENPIEGVEEYEVAAGNHVQGLPEPEPVDGELLPPVGGPHDPAWQNCGVYEAPVYSRHAMHSMEHGAVWVTYNPDLTTSEDVSTLKGALLNKSYTLMSPMPEQTVPIALTAWGVQLSVEEAADERVELFLTKYIQGPQTPEPGAACSGAVSSTR